MTVPGATDLSLPIRVGGGLSQGCKPGVQYARDGEGNFIQGKDGKLKQENVVCVVDAEPPRDTAEVTPQPSGTASPKQEEPGIFERAWNWLMGN